MTKIVVLGGGPAGYVAALRAAQLGAAVTLVEEREIGGTCLNRGCIPTKSMVAGAERLRARDDAAFGVVTGRRASTWRRSWPARTTCRPSSAAASSICCASARSRSSRLAAGSPDPDVCPRGRRVLERRRRHPGHRFRPVQLPVFATGDQRVLTSDGLLRIDHIPARLVIVGGGVIGCEFASIFARLGTPVTVVEMLEHLLPGEDKRVGRTLQQAFKKAGIEVVLKAGVESSEGREDGVHVTLAGGHEP